MNMKVGDVSRQLLDLLQQHFDGYGFRLNRSKKRFVREKGGIRQEVALLFDQSADGVLLSAMLYVVSEEIEKIFYNATGEKSNFHLGIDLFDAKRFIEEGDGKSVSNRDRFIFASPEDVPRVAEVMLDYFDKYALAYFSKSDAVEQIDALINKNPHELSAHHPIYPSRAAIGLIAAHLSKNLRFNELRNLYRSEVLEAAESFRVRFDRVCEYLQNEQ